MKEIIDKLRERLANMTQEELDAEWEKLAPYNEIGPTVDEYFKELKKWGLYPEELNNENNIS